MKTLFKLPAYVGIICKRDDQILLVQRQNSEWRSGYWNFPGGLLEENEMLAQAALREAHEEIGIEANVDEIDIVHVLHVHSGNASKIIGFYFLFNSWKNEPFNKEPDRHSAIGWFDINNLPENITTHALHAIEGLKYGKRYSESEE